MKCDEIKILFGKYFNIEHKDFPLEIVKNHLETCNGCRKKFETYFFLNDFFQKDRTVKVNPFLFTRIQQKIKSSQKEGREMILLPKYVLPIAISILLMFFVFTGYTMVNVQRRSEINNYAAFFEDEMFGESFQIEVLEEMFK